MEKIIKFKVLNNADFDDKEVTIAILEAEIRMNTSSKLRFYLLSEDEDTSPFPKMEITDERRQDMLIGALEGGSNYWYWLTEEAGEIISKFSSDYSVPLAIRMWEAIKAGETIEIHDKEDIEGEKIGEIDLQSIIKGEQLMRDQQPQHYTDIINENDDANTADVWFQYACLGELVYG